MKKITGYCLFLLAVICYSCEYPNEGEYFKTVEKSAEEHPFSIELDFDSDTILITKPTELLMNLDAAGLELDMNNYDDQLGCRIMIDNKELDIQKTYDGSARFKYSTLIYPSEFTDGLHTLTLYLITQNSGSGSLADSLGLERYTAVKTWDVIIQDYNYLGTNMMQLHQTQTAEGFLQLYWEKPPVIIGLIGYRIRWYNGESRDTLLSDPNITNFIDKSFTCGEVDYLAFAVVKGFNETDDYYADRIKYRGELKVSEPLPQVTVKNNYHFKDSVIVTWTKTKYPAQYAIYQYSSYYPIIETGDTIAVIKGPANFGEVYGYRLCTFSEYQDIGQLHYGYNSNDFSAQKGKFMATNHPDYGFNPIENRIYTNSYDEVLCYDASTLEIVKEKTIQNLIYEGLYSCPTNSAHIAVFGDENTIIFNSGNFNVATVIQNENWMSNLSHFKMTNNKLLAVAGSWEKKYALFNTETGEELLSFIPNTFLEYIDPKRIDTSQDGRYVVLANENNLILYSIEDYKKESIIYSDNRTYISAIFHPLHPNLLLVQTDKVVEIREVPSFQLKKSFNINNDLNLCNIDPVSGLLLMANNEKSCVIDLDTGNIIHQIKGYGEYNNRLYSNILFNKSGYAYDLTKSQGK